MTDQPVIELNNVSFSYDGAPALVNASMKVFEREFVCLVGPNGGGKTTLAKLILGLLKPKEGVVRVYGRPPEEVRGRIGYVSQYLLVDSAFPINVMDVVLMGRSRSGMRLGPFGAADRGAARRALAEVGIEEMAGRPFGDLSGGQRQRALIARALASEPDLLILDEPTSGLDADVESRFYELLRDMNQRMTLLLVSHDLWFVSRFVNKVVCVRREVQSHDTGEVDEAALGSLCGLDMRVVHHDRMCPGSDCA